MIKLKHLKLSVFLILWTFLQGICRENTVALFRFLDDDILIIDEII